MPIEYDKDGSHFYDAFGVRQNRYFEPHMNPLISYNSSAGVTDGNFKLMIRDGNDYYIIQRVQTNEAWFNDIINYGNTLSYTVGSDGYLIFSPYRPRQWINVRVQFWNTANPAAIKIHSIARPAFLNLATRTIDGVLFDRPRMIPNSRLIDFSCELWIRSTATAVSSASEVYYNPVINGISLLSHIFTDANSGTLRTAYYDTEVYTNGSRANIKANGAWQNWNSQGVTTNINFYTKYENAMHRFNYMWLKDNNTWKSIYRQASSDIKQL